MITFSQIGRHGRIGNQLFQYATVFAVAKNKNYIIGMPYANKTQIDYPNFCLRECFPYLSAADSSGRAFYNNYHETSFAFQQHIFNIDDETDVFGYFQSPKYFQQYKHLLLQEFKFKSDILAKATSIRDSLKKETVMLHMRLGDYTWKTHYHPICNVEYYKNALSQIPELRNKEVLLFSDEVDKAKQILHDLDLRAIESNDKFVDLCLMTLCDYHIIANSTFSWWGAYLSKSKKIFAPKNWFGYNSDAPQNWGDIYCEDWIII